MPGFHIEHVMLKYLVYHNCGCGQRSYWDRYLLHAFWEVLSLATKKERFEQRLFSSRRCLLKKIYLLKVTKLEVPSDTRLQKKKQSPTTGERGRGSLGPTLNTVTLHNYDVVVKRPNSVYGVRERKTTVFISFSKLWQRPFEFNPRKKKSPAFGKLSVRHTTGEIKTGNVRYHAIFTRVDISIRSFDSLNVLSV